MRVLMFGWEFPPHISGGLGTACYGITRGLTTLGNVEILFVVPKAFGDEDQQTIKLLGANEVYLGEREVNYEWLLRKISYIEVGSNLVPYTTPEEYEILSEENKSENREFINKRQALILISGYFIIGKGFKSGTSPDSFFKN